MNAGKGLTKSQQENNIIMATRRQEEEHLTPEQRALALVKRQDFGDSINAELTTIIRENEELKATLKATTDCVDILHAYETIAKQQSELTQLRKVCDDWKDTAEMSMTLVCNASGIQEAARRFVDEYYVRLHTHNNLPHVKGKK